MPFLGGITQFLLQLGQALIGPFGLAVITVAIAGTIISALVFHTPISWIWRSVFLSVCLVGVGVISNAIASFAGA
jgi:hypothetical protein